VTCLPARVVAIARDPSESAAGAVGESMRIAILERFHSNVGSAGLYPGWTMVFVSSVSLAVVFTASTATIPLLYSPVIDEFGWSRTQATLVFTCKNVASGIAALFMVGPLCERFGLRCVSVGAFIITASGMTLFLWVDSLTSYYFAGIVLGIGVAATFISAKLLVSRWFFRNQGLALGIMLGGSALGSLCFPIMFTMLERELGWRVGFAALSIGVWCVALPLYLAKAKENPSSVDVQQERPEVPPALSVETSGDACAEFASLLQGREFWLIAASLILAAAADAGLMQHTALYLERESGLAMTTTAFAISGMLGLGFVAKAGAGWVFDRLSLKGIQLWYVLLALSIALALSVAGTMTLIVFALMRGIAHGGLMSEPAIVAKQCYGPQRLNMTVSTFIGLWAVGASIGPLLLSLLYDAQGTYRNGFLSLIAMAVLAAIALSGVQPKFHSS
jgi:MFS family permease